MSPNMENVLLRSLIETFYCLSFFNYTKIDEL